MSENYREALVRKRAEILTTGGVRPLAATMENNSRQGDMADQADGNNEVHIQLKLKQTDAKILQAIEAGRGQAEDIEVLSKLTRWLGPGKTFCPHAPGAMEPLQSALK